MKYKGWNQARDANEKEIVAALRDRGALVVRLSQPCDLLVGYRGVWSLAEVKDGPKARIQPSQKDFRDQCERHGVPLIFLFSLEDVDYWYPAATQNIGTGEKIV